MDYQNIFRNFIITRRQFLLSCFKVSLLGVIAARLGYLQLLKHKKYSLLSDKNSITTILIAPLRGEILDINGHKIALNQQRFKLILSRPYSKKSKLSLAKLFDVLNLDPAEREAFKLKIHNKSFNGNLIENLSWDQIVLIEQNIFDLEHIRIDSYFTRIYPYSDFLTHPTGYTASATEAEIEELEVKQINNFTVGKSGVEKYYNKKLVGSFGFKQVEVDAHGNNIRELDFIPSKQGEDITLTLDCNLQSKICQMLNNLSGSVIVTDLKKEKLLSLVSVPNFQANSFTDGISRNYWSQLNSDIKLPLLNKVIQATYPPGSIFKLVTALAALNSGWDPQKKVLCLAGGFLGNHFHCWQKHGHGSLNMEEALGCSCNYYMYHIAKTIGHKAIIEMALKLSLGKKTGVDLPCEASGFLPQEPGIFDNWKFASTLNLSIGQGLITTTPLQLNRLVSIIATRGKKMNYSLMNSENTENAECVDIDSKHFDIIHKGMWRSVNHCSGTGQASAIRNLIVAGKTGTAQVQSKKNAKVDFNASNIPWNQKNHALFVCFAPFDDPKYSITVVLEHAGGGGKNAAPVAKGVLELLMPITT
jgi:penicillin-binding protein 2